MPNPTAHADDMKSPAEYTPPPAKDILPDFWWLNPWNTVLGLLHKVDHLKSTSRGEQASRINAERIMGEALDASRLAKREKAAAVEALGKHARNYTAVIGPEGVDLPACITTLVRNYEELNKWNDEFCAERNKALDELADADLKVNATLHLCSASTWKDGKTFEEKLMQVCAGVAYWRNEADVARVERGELREKLAQANADLAELHQAIDDDYAAYVKKLKRNPKAKHKPIKIRKAKPAKAKKKGGSK